MLQGLFEGMSRAGFGLLRRTAGSERRPTPFRFVVLTFCLRSTFCLAALFPIALGSDSSFEQEIEKQIPTLRRWAADPVIVSSTRLANTRLRSTSAIKDADEQWQSTSGIDDFMRSLMTNACAKRLQKLRANQPAVAEAFVTDRLGANIAMTNKTSDYWQGDEAKFTKAINGNRNTYHREPVTFDESIQAYAVQIALPVWDGNTAAGVIVFTINLEMLERTQ